MVEAVLSSMITCFVDEGIDDGIAKEARRKIFRGLWEDAMPGFLNGGSSHGAKDKDVPAPAPNLGGRPAKQARGKAQHGLTPLAAGTKQTRMDYSQGNSHIYIYAYSLPIYMCH